MTEAAKYVKIVEWSEADGAFIGQCPGVIGPCCHGPDETEVYRELCVRSSKTGSLYSRRMVDHFLRQRREETSPASSPKFVLNGLHLPR